MNIQEYINQQKELYEAIMRYLPNDVEESDDEIHLFQFLLQHQNNLQKDELQCSLLIISKISENYHRTATFFSKIEKILLHYFPQITQTFTNTEIFKIFENNKRILLFLFEQKIINPDESIIKIIREINDICELQYIGEIDAYRNVKIGSKNYDSYLYPEIKDHLNEEEIQLIEQQIKDYSKSEFESLRKSGENDHYICQLIRQDSIEEFIAYVNQNDITKSAQIVPSIFETNPFLIQKNPTIIEYAAFFGSIRILQYYLNDLDELLNSLWLYGIHSNNPEIIHFFIENNVSPMDKTYEQCLEESIKCHHNGIASYILDNLIDEEDKQKSILESFDKNYFAYCFHNYNFHFCDEILKSKYALFYFCELNNYKLVKFYLEQNDQVELNNGLMNKTTIL